MPPCARRRLDRPQPAGRRARRRKRRGHEADQRARKLRGVVVFTLFSRDGVPVACIAHALQAFDGDEPVGFDLVAVVRVGADLPHFLELSSGAVFELDRRLRIAAWNETAAAITSHDEAAVRGVELLPNFISEDFRPAFGRVLADALAGSTVLSYTVPRSVGGVYSPLQLNCFPSRVSASATPSGVVLVVQGLAGAARLARVWVDTSLRVTDSNRLMQDMYGGPLRAPGLAPGPLSLVDDLVHADAAPALLAAIEAVPTRGPSEPFALPLRTASGRVRHMMVRATARRNLAGCIERYELTEETGAGAAMPDAVQPLVRTDADGNLVEFSAAAEAATGKRAADVLGRPVSCLLDEPFAFARGADEGSCGQLSAAVEELEGRMRRLGGGAAEMLCASGIEAELEASRACLERSLRDPQAMGVLREAAAHALLGARTCIQSAEAAVERGLQRPGRGVVDAVGACADKMQELLRRLDEAADAAAVRRRHRTLAELCDAATWQMGEARADVEEANDAVARLWKALA